MKPSGIGGQAVIEGVMMKNQDIYAVAVRKPDKKIEVKKEEYKSIQKKHPFFGLPIIRGVAAFVESLVVGMKTLTYSASFYEEEEEASQSKLEKGMGRVFKDKAEAVLMGFTIVLSILLAVGIFMVLPFFAAELCKQMTENKTALAVIEGAIRIAIFLIYIVAISQMKDIRRVFMYHGAEHKTINCVEQGLELNVKNVRKQSRYHKRCGTSFMFFVVLLSVIFFIFIRFDIVWLRLASRVLLVPIIAGIAYEFIRFAGRSESGIANFFSKPGMWLQSLTTREPEDDMIQVAIASVEAVFDWKAYQLESQNGKKSSASSKKKETEKNIRKGNVQLEGKGRKGSQEKKAQEEIAVSEAQKGAKKENSKVIEFPESSMRAAKKADKSRYTLQTLKNASEEAHTMDTSALAAHMLEEEEDDEILNALDRYFVFEESIEKDKND